MNNKVKVASRGVYFDWITYVTGKCNKELSKEQERSCDKCDMGCATCINSLVGLEMDYESDDLTAVETKELEREFMSRVRDYVGYSLVQRTLYSSCWDKFLVEILYRNPDAEVTREEVKEAEQHFEYLGKATKYYGEYLESK